LRDLVFRSEVEAPLRRFSAAGVVAKLGPMPDQLPGYSTNGTTASNLNGLALLRMLEELSRADG
jgi:hypothetical protein